jgi:hypothetical protein
VFVAVPPPKNRTPFAPERPASKKTQQKHAHPFPFKPWISHHLKVRGFAQENAIFHEEGADSTGRNARLRP